MSGLSPSRRLRTKTSDLTDFFRGSTNSSSQLRPTKKDASTSSMHLEVPSAEDATSVKKKITRIPLFGRSRKKSNQSSSSSPFTSSTSARDSSELGESSNTSRAASTDTRRPSVPSIVSIPIPPLPKVPPPSLGSKLAAHFSHSRAPKQFSNAPASSTPSQPTVASSGLEPPSTRSSISESGSSSHTRTRSITPRPDQPVITVSLSPDEQFKDLFTKPRHLAGPSQSAEKLKRRSADTASDATPPGSRTQSPEQSIYRRGHTPASAIAAAARHRQNPSVGSDRAPSTSSKASNSRKGSDSDKSNEASTSLLSEPRDSPRLEAEKSLPPSLQRKPSAPTGTNPNPSDNGSSTVRSRMKRPPATTPAKTRPPSMPLPLPPTPNPPSATHPSVPNLRELQLVKASTSSKPFVRPRAHTVGAVVDPSTPLAPLTRPPANKPTPPTFTPTPAKADGEPLDIDNASIEELRYALKLRNLQYDELASFVLKMTEAHVAEVTTLEKKISTLTKDALKREKQIKGFTILLSDEESSSYHPKPLPPGILNQSRFASSRSAGVDSDQDRNPPPSRRYQYQSDSGAESHATSGGESFRASGASGSESTTSMIRNKKLRRPYLLGDQAYAATRMGSILRSSRLPPGVNSPDKGLPDTPYMNSKRSSVSSISGSPSSSTSSLLPPSPSITVSSLSAIPEGPSTATTLRLQRYDNNTSNPETQKEERRALRNAHCTSTSSLTSSSTAASSSYSTTIKRSRPPSIAQVLEKTPTLDDVLEKLRPFS